MKSLRFPALLQLLLLATAVLGGKKPDVAGHQRQDPRLRPSDAKPSAAESLRADESKYSAKAEAERPRPAQQPYYAPTAPPQELANQDGDYAELQSYESFRYATQSPDYSQEKYQDTSDAPDYLQQTSLESQAPEQHQQQQQQQEQQYYVSEGRSNSHNYSPLPKHRHQQPVYQQEVLVGNQHQSVQQKAATQKYVEENSDKDNYYVNTPANQLLAYYQNFEIVHPKSKTADQPISIPIYMPLLAQTQPTKVSYQPDVQYVTSPKHTQAIFSKSSKSSSPVHPAPSAASAASSVHQLTAAGYQQYPTIDLLMSPAYAPQQPQYYVTAQPQQLAQAQPQYVAHHHTQQQPHQQPQQQQQHQQQQQILYENPAAAYADIYSAPASPYLQDNALYEQQPQHHPQQQYYVPRALAEQLMAQILQQAGIHSAADATQQYIQPDAQEPLQHDQPPQYQAQKFRENGGVTHLVPVAGESDAFPPRPSYPSAYTSPSQPKTLLDSYVPSHVIAAQDANRYRERPIKLESGFLPSKINFLRSYKKRKTE